MTDVSTDTGALRELRDQLERLASHKIAYVNQEQRWGRSKVVDAVLALPALRDLIAERDQAVAAVERVERVLAFYDRHEYSTLNVDDLRRALDPT